jgi:hypothetical protein
MTTFTHKLNRATITLFNTNHEGWAYSITIMCNEANQNFCQSHFLTSRYAWDAAVAKVDELLPITEPTGV